jgi:hypothetical protein
VGKKTQKSSNEQLDQLRDLVAESDADGNGAQPKKTDRRSLLKLAGAAALGVAGMAAVKVVPAAAATGGNLILGCNNAAANETNLNTTGTISANLFTTGSDNTYGVWAGATSGSDEIALFGQSKSGTGIGVAGTTDSGTAVVGTASGSGNGVLGQATGGRGVYGLVATGVGVYGTAASSGTGVVGTAGAGGVGVDGGASDNRGGLFTSTTGYDVALGYPVAGGAVGSGRLGMVGRLDVGANAPNIAPAFAVTSLGGNPIFEHEFVRGNDSSIWASRFTGTGTNQSRWKRINAVRVDSSDGLGSPFKPFRVLDTRSGAIKAVNTMTLVNVAGLGSGTSNIPADAVAVIGNLTAVAYTGGGFLAIMPGGIVQGTGAGQYNHLVDPSSVNFIVGQGAIANSFVCGLHGGQVQVFVAGHSSHFIVDITGYMQ